MNFFITFAILCQILCIYLLVRNQIVFNYRRKLLNATRDIVRPEVALKYLAEFDKAPYAEMVWQFWRPLDSFFSKEFTELIK